MSNALQILGGNKRSLSKDWQAVTYTTPINYSLKFQIRDFELVPN